MPRRASAWHRVLALGVATAVVRAGTALAPPAKPTGPEPTVRLSGASEANQGDKGEPAAREMGPSRSFFEIMEKGGILMWPIAFCSFLMLAFLLERTVALRRGRVIPKPFVHRVLGQIREGQLEREQALALCEESRSPVAEVFAGAIRKWGRPSVEVEQAIIDAGERVTNDLRRYLRIFNGVHTVAPLLGLLGTVFGMIKAFNMVAVSDALGRPELLAAGISEALLTTAAGLAVAIPALIIYVFFVSRVDRLVIEIDHLGQELVTLISAEDLQTRGPEAHAPKPRRSLRHETAGRAAEGK